MITSFLLYFAVVCMYIKIYNTCSRWNGSNRGKEEGAARLTRREHIVPDCARRAVHWAENNYARWVKNHLNGTSGVQWTIWRCLITSAASASLLLYPRTLTLTIFLLIRVIPLLAPSPRCKPTILKTCKCDTSFQYTSSTRERIHSK